MSDDATSPNESPSPEASASAGPKRMKGSTVLVGMVAVLLVVFTILVTTIALPAFAKTRVPVAGYQVVATYPHDKSAFTQGLVYADMGGDIGDAFFESTGQYGHSSLRLVDLDTGKVLRKANLSKEYFAEGLAYLNGKLYQLTWREGKCFVYDATTFEFLDEFTLPTDERTNGPIEGWGLTTDGESLIISDGSYRLRFLDPETYRMTNLIEVRDELRPIMKLNELEFMYHEIWANVWGADSIVRINPKTGSVRGYVDLKNILPLRKRLNREAVLNGIAFDAKRKRIFVTGKLWPNIFEIRLTGETE